MAGVVTKRKYPQTRIRAPKIFDVEVISVTSNRLELLSGFGMDTPSRSTREVSRISTTRTSMRQLVECFVPLFTDLNNLVM